VERNSRGLLKGAIKVLAWKDVATNQKLQSE